MPSSGETRPSAPYERHSDLFQALLMWQAFYAGSLAFIKSSICITLMRITQQRMYLNILRGLIILSAALSTVGLIIIVNQCHPLTRYWDKRVPGTCWPPIIATVLSYIASASNVVTDLTVAVIPIFLLRQIQMRSRLKLYVRLILGLGILYVPDLYLPNNLFRPNRQYNTR